MDERIEKFLKDNHLAVMTTLRPDGSPHSVMVGVGLVDGSAVELGNARPRSHQTP